MCVNLFLDIFIGIIRGNGLKVPLVLGHVLLNLLLLVVYLSPRYLSMYFFHLEFQIVDEGPVLSVDHAVGERETEEANSDQGQAKQQENPSLTVLRTHDVHYSVVRPWG